MKSLVDAYKELKKDKGNTTLVYGNPKTGKTAMISGIARAKQVNRILWFDVDCGSDTLLNPDPKLRLSTAELSKIKLVNFKESVARPHSIETLLKFFSTDKPILHVCLPHGIVDCTRCTSETKYNLPAAKTLTFGDVIVLDSLTQVGLSAYWAGCILAKGSKNKYEKYVEQGRLLGDLVQLIKCSQVPVLCTAHTTVLNENDEDETKPRIVCPKVGTDNFSRNVAGAFSNVVQVVVEERTYMANSTPTHRCNTIAGSRAGAKMEKVKGTGVDIASLHYAKIA